MANGRTRRERIDKFKNVWKDISRDKNENGAKDSTKQKSSVTKGLVGVKKKKM